MLEHQWKPAVWGEAFFFFFLLTWASFNGVRDVGAEGGAHQWKALWGTCTSDENVLFVHFWHKLWLARSYEVWVG